MTNKILTDDDVKKVWEDITIISKDTVMKMIDSGGVKPIPMSNGYSASLSLVSKTTLSSP